MGKTTIRRMRGIAGREEGWGWSDPCGEEEDDLLQGLEPERLDSGKSCQQWGGREEGDADPGRGTCCSHQVLGPVQTGLPGF